MIDGVKGKDQGKNKGKNLSFLVRIQYRQNASWQGSLQWLDEKKSIPFRSLLEMVALLREAVEEAKHTAKADFHSWQDREEIIS